MGNSTSSITISLEQTQEELAELMMPPYYIRNLTVTDYDISLARASWKAIIDGTSPAFIEEKKNPSFHAASCLTWFYDSFYLRLFDVNPAARPMFKTNIQSQGRVLMGIISTALNQLKDPSSFERMLVNLAHTHSDRGVRGVQYGIMGDVLFWTLRKCLGARYDVATAHSWTKIFSYMLKVIVPVAVADEISELRSLEKQDKISSELSLSGRSKKKSIYKSIHIYPSEDNLSGHTFQGDIKKTWSGGASSKHKSIVTTARNSKPNINGNEVVPFEL